MKCVLMTPVIDIQPRAISSQDRKSTRLNSSHTVIYTLSLHDALPISLLLLGGAVGVDEVAYDEVRVDDARDRHPAAGDLLARSEEHTSELQSHSDLHSFPTRRSSDLAASARRCRRCR